MCLGGEVKLLQLFMPKEISFHVNSVSLAKKLSEMGFVTHLTYSFGVKESFPTKHLTESCLLTLLSTFIENKFF